MRAARLFAFLGVAASLAGCHPQAPPPPPPAKPPAPPRVIAGTLDPAPLLADVSSRAMRMGAGPMAIVAAGAAEERELFGAFIELPQDGCVLAYARGSSSIDDVDLIAYDDEGRPMAVDQGSDPKPTLLLCPPGPPRAYLIARVQTGDGLVGVAVQTVPRERAADIAEAFNAHGAAEGSRRPEAWPGLQDHVRAHRQALGGSWEELPAADLVVDSRAPTAMSFTVDADQCVDAVLVPGEDVALLDVEAVDEAGRVLARAREGGSDRTLTVCSPVPFAGSLVVRPHIGRGRAAVVLARMRASAARDLTAKPEVLWETTTISLQNATTERNETLGRAGYGTPRFTTAGTLTLGRRSSIPIDFGTELGVCTRLDVVAGAPLSLVDARAWTDEGTLVTTDEGAWGATLFACARGKGRVDLETRGRSGPFSLSGRTERWHDAAFGEHPLAAARMLARASEGPERVLPGVPVSVRAVALEPDRLVSWTETVPPWGCLSVSVGAEGEGTGLELRAFDPASGEELDRSHAQHAVGVRTCAPRSVVPVVRFELRATSGRLAAVIGERVR